MAGKSKKLTMRSLSAEIEILKDKLEDMNELKQRVKQLEAMVREFGTFACELRMWIVIQEYWNVKCVKNNLVNIVT